MPSTETGHGIISSDAEVPEEFIGGSVKIVAQNCRAKWRRGGHLEKRSRSDTLSIARCAR